MLEAYSDIKDKFQKLNNCVGPFCVLSFISLIIFSAAQLSNVMDSDSWSFRLVILYYFTMQGSILVMAAEANHQVSLKVIILHKYEVYPVLPYL